MSSERTACELVRVANLNPHSATKNLQEDVAKSGALVRHPTVQRYSTKKGRISRRKSYQCLHH